MRKKTFVRFLARGLLAFLWLSTLAVTLIWVTGLPAPFDPEPVTVLLGLVSVAVSALVAEYVSLLEEEAFSAPHALAYGYVNNFLEPVITRLVETVPPGEPLRFFIFEPGQLEDLSPSAVKRTMAELRRLGYSSEVVNLELEAGRARDILTVFRDGPGSVSYFDFPNTLLTLDNLVEYKVPSREGSLAEEKKRELGCSYIRVFMETVRKQADQKRLTPYLRFTGPALEGLEAERDNPGK